MHTALERDSGRGLEGAVVGKAWRCEQLKCCKSELTQTKHNNQKKMKESIMYQKDHVHILKMFYVKIHVTQITAYPNINTPLR